MRPNNLGPQGRPLSGFPNWVAELFHVGRWSKKGGDSFCVWGIVRILIQR